MLTGKQRAFLRSMANGIRPISQIGKEGVTDAFLKQLGDALEAREIVKVTVLENSGLDVKECANEVAMSLRADVVQAIGSKFTIYRKSKEKPVISIPKR